MATNLYIFSSLFHSGFICCSGSAFCNSNRTLNFYGFIEMKLSDLQWLSDSFSRHGNCSSNSQHFLISCSDEPICKLFLRNEKLPSTQTRNFPSRFYDKKLKSFNVIYVPFEVQVVNSFTCTHKQRCGFHTTQAMKITENNLKINVGMCNSKGLYVEWFWAALKEESCSGPFWKHSHWSSNDSFGIYVIICLMQFKLQLV